MPTIAATLPSSRSLSATAVAAPPSTLEQETARLLDQAAAELHAGQWMPAFKRLGVPLSALWSEARGTGRADDMKRWCAGHALHALVQQDPYTDRASRKPRGYAGDAVMMDYIYSGQAPEGTSGFGRGVFSATTRASMGLSVLYRRQLLKSLLDDTVVSCDAGRVLSVASGHARELEGSLVGSPLFQGEVVALDQDPLSCAEVARVHQGARVRVVNQGVRELLTGPLAPSLGEFDLIYSAGLYDYLPDALATRLTRRLLQMLRPGGRLLIANFVPSGSGRGYMELFMDWTLVLRNEAQMRAIAQDSGAAQFSSFMDPHRNVVYVEMQRTPAAA
jgi:extracellular factor (EF) 3-hydroxypalmitic acid methyl ester biosynthesis protein